MKVVPMLAEIVALTPAVIALDRRPPWQLRPTLRQQAHHNTACAAQAAP
jgi:hypothetical protein